MKILSEHELARELGVSYWTVRNLRIQKGLPHFRTEGRVFYRWESVVHWMDQEEAKNCKPN